MKEKVFQFYIRLLESDPPVWRRFQVKNHITFDYFHYIIQAVMGWGNFHLYEFKFKKYSILSPGSEPSQMEKAIQVFGNEMALSDMLNKVGQKFLYIYDFGDDWRHEIIFEKSLPVDEKKNYPVCIDGAMACPPEDIGGVDLYYEYVEKQRKDLDHFNPEYFNLDKINDDLKANAIIQSDLEYDWILEENLDIFLNEIDKPFRLDQCLKKIDLEITKENKERISNLLVTSGEVALDNNLFYPRVYFLKDFAIRIMPTDFEIENGVLIPGHRVIPFLPCGMLSDEVEILYKNKPLEQTDLILSVNDLDTYFGMVDSSELPIIDIGYQPHREHRFSLLGINATQFYKDNNFEPGDSIILTMKDFDNSVFSIHYDSATNFKANEEAVKTWDKLFIASLKKVLQENSEECSLETQLMYAYYYMSRTMSAEQKKIPGTEVALCLNRTNEICWSEVEDSGMMLHLGGKVVVNLPHKDS